MTQSRVVIRAEVLDIGERLMQVTRAGSISEVIAIMFTRYASHLEQTWEVKALPHAAYSASPEPQPINPPSVVSNDFKFDEPISEF